MNDIVFKPWDIQKKIIIDNNRIIAGFSGKRGSKTMGMSIKSILTHQNKPNIENFLPEEKYVGVVVAPTTDMLVRLSLPPILTYGEPFISDYKKTPFHKIIWEDEVERKFKSEIWGISGDKVNRLEGLKAGWIWIDEVFQTTEALFLECVARVSDSEGFLFCTGSLGVQYVNPKAHWAYKYFKETPFEGTSVYEWATSANPYFPQKELARLKATLDPKTFRQMYEIDWDTPPTNAVYKNFDDANIGSFNYNPMMPVYVAIDWGWAHPMACLFIQYDAVHDRVYVIDEIVQSRLKLDDLHQMILDKSYRVDTWICDIAGNQEREQTALSNIDWFKEKGIHFKYRYSNVLPGISLVRRYIKNSFDLPRLFVGHNCKMTLDSAKRYHYKEKDGMILNENPVKEEDDPVDALRYFFVNILDEEYTQTRTNVRKAF